MHFFFLLRIKNEILVMSLFVLNLNSHRATVFYTYVSHTNWVLLKVTQVFLQYDLSKCNLREKFYQTNPSPVFCRYASPIIVIYGLSKLNSIYSHLSKPPTAGKYMHRSYLWILHFFVILFIIKHLVLFCSSIFRRVLIAFHMVWLYTL